MSQEWTYYKYLDCITPKKANELGIPAEAPVFVSPTVKNKQVCQECGIEYGPLIYSAGRVVTSHHFHKEGGGIYYSMGDIREKNPEDLPMHTLDDRPSWLALLTPMTDRSNDLSSLFAGRSESVHIDQIIPIFKVFGRPIPISEGVVFIHQYDRETSGYLFPAPLKAALLFGEKPVFNFRSFDREIYFSQFSS